jgi:hypothetical protein
MRRDFLQVLILLSSVAVSSESCKSGKATTQRIEPRSETTTIVQAADPTYARINRFVSVDAVSELRTGMTYQDVLLKMAAKPYNILSAQADGHHIVHYKYRLTKMEVPTTEVNNLGIEKSNNRVFYNPGEEDLYVVFNAAGKLEYMVTSQGSMSEKLLRDNNLLYVIKKDKDKFAADADKNYRQTNSGAFHPLLPCTNCPDKKEEAKPAEDKSNTKGKQ